MAMVTVCSVAVGPVLTLMEISLRLRAQTRRDREHRQMVAGLVRSAAIVVIVAPAQDD